MSRYCSVIAIHTIVNTMLYKEAKKHNVAWSYALNLGIRKAVDERTGVKEKDSKELIEKVDSLARMLSTNQRLTWKLEDELKQYRMQKKL